LPEHAKYRRAKSINSKSFQGRLYKVDGKYPWTAWQGRPGCVIP
jgi:hypothetical protein